MKKVLILTVAIGALLAASFYFSQDNDNGALAINDQGFVINKFNTPAGEVANDVNWTRPKKNNKDERGIKHAAKYLAKLRANPNGEYNPMDYYKARVALENKSNSTAKQAASLGLEWEVLGPNNVGGRTRGFLIDVDANKLYSGGVTGGLFTSNNQGESWESHPQNAIWNFFGISSIKKASNGDVYFGTGEYFVFTQDNAAGHIGGGIYKSTDGGETFQVLPLTVPNPNDANDDWSFVTEIDIDPNNSSRIYASTATGTRNSASPGGGLFYSEDGGQTWNPANVPSGQREALDVLVNDNGVVFLCQDRQYYRSTDGVNFQLQSGQGGFPVSGASRIEFAVAPQDPNYVYALIANNNSGLYGIYKSTDGGINWQTISPVNSETFNPLGEQGFYDMCITVSSDNKDRLFVGGQLEFYAGQSGGWNLIASAFRNGVVGQYYIHADMHGIYNHPNNPDELYVVSDGGVHKSLNATTQFPTFEDANKLYHTTQFYTIQADDLGRNIGGTQDNGMQLIDGQRNSIQTSEDLAGFGDGGFGAISEVNNDAMFGQSQFGALRRSSNGGESFGGFYDDKVDEVNNDNNNAGGDGLPDVGTEFIAIGYLWEANPDDVTFEINNPNTAWVDTFVTISDKKSIFFLGANGRLYFTPEAIEFSIQPRWFDIRTAGTVTAIDGTKDGKIFAGTSNGNFYEVDGITDKYKYDTVLVERIAQIELNGSDTSVTVVDKTIRLVPDYPEDNIADWNWNSTALDNHQGVNRVEVGNGLPNRYITGIAVDPNFDSNGQIVVTFPGYGQSTYIYRSTGLGGYNFNDITNDYVLAPVYDAVISADNSDHIIIATDLGIFTSNDGGSSWAEDNNGIFRTPTFKLFQNKLYEEGCNVIYAGSYGRGAHRTTSLTAAGCDTEPYKGINVSVEEPIDKYVTAELKVYPNPATNNVFVEIDNSKFDNNAVLTLVDLSGKVLMQERLQDGLQNRRHEVDVSALSSGYYILSITDGNQSLSSKIMVNR